MKLRFLNERLIRLSHLGCDVLETLHSKILFLTQQNKVAKLRLILKLCNFIMQAFLYFVICQKILLLFILEMDFTKIMYVMNIYYHIIVT